MREPFVDTDVLIRLLTGDDPLKQAQAAALFQRVESGQLTLSAPVTVIADTVYVLSSRRLYNLPRAQIRALLEPLLRLPGFKVQHRRALQLALVIYAASNLDFGDALIVANMQLEGSTSLYSYDADFDRFAPIVSSSPDGSSEPRQIGQPCRLRSRRVNPGAGNLQSAAFLHDRSPLIERGGIGGSSNLAQS